MASPLSPDNRNYRPDIDGLRAIAITTVVAYHAGVRGFSGGFVGVDVFFVISGFLITALLFAEVAAKGRIDLPAFYARRVRRLMPAAFVVTAATLLLGAIFLLPSAAELLNLVRSAGAAAVFGSNFFFWQETGGYFDAPFYNFPLLHTWSLAVEEQYYLVWPLLLILAFRFAPKAIGERSMRHRVIALLGSMLIASLALSIWLTPRSPNAAFYLLPTRIWEFAIGGIVGLGAGLIAKQLQRWGGTIALVGLAAIVFAVVVLDRHTAFPGYAATIPVAGTALLLLGTTADANGWVCRLLSTRPFVAIGLLSYSWYLWHWPLLSIRRMVALGVHDTGQSVLLALVALLLAWLTYVIVENPIRRRRPWPFSTPKITLRAGGVLCALTIVLTIGLLGWREYRKNSAAMRPFVAATKDVSPYQHACLIHPGKMPRELPLERCVNGPDPAHPKILLWGDSHADHWMPMLMEVFPERGVYDLSMLGCMPSFGNGMGKDADNAACIHFNQMVLERIRLLRRQGLETVVISARWARNIDMPSIALADSDEMPATAEAIRAASVQFALDLENTLATLETLGLRVLVIVPTPELVYPAPQCIARNPPERCTVPRSLEQANLGGVQRIIATVVARHPNARLFDSVDYFCDAEHCRSKRGDTVLYFDEDHISASAAREIGRMYKEQLDWLRVSGRQFPINQP